jgi:hypothetical protein
VWLCAGIELPAARRVIAVIAPDDSFWWRTFIEMPEFSADHARSDVLSFISYMWFPLRHNG